MRVWTWVERIEGGMASVGAGLCLLAMLLMTVVSVFGRYVLGADLIPGTYNIIERLLFRCWSSGLCRSPIAREHSLGYTLARRRYRRGRRLEWLPSC